MWQAKNWDLDGKIFKQDTVVGTFAKVGERDEVQGARRAEAVGDTNIVGTIYMTTRNLIAYVLHITTLGCKYKL